MSTIINGTDIDKLTPEQCRDFEAEMALDRAKENMDEEQIEYD